MNEPKRIELTPPYTAVLFISRRRDSHHDEYAKVAGVMESLASTQPGFLGIESVRGPDRVGITLSYWKDAASALAWKRQADHLAAQNLGRDRFYEWYQLRVATVEREYGFDHPGEPKHLP